VPEIGSTAESADREPASTRVIAIAALHASVESGLRNHGWSARRGVVNLVHVGATPNGFRLLLRKCWQKSRSGKCVVGVVVLQLILEVLAKVDEAMVAPSRVSRYQWYPFET